MSEKYLNPNNLAKVCSDLAKATGNYKLDDLAILLSAHEESFYTIIYKTAMEMPQEYGAVPEE